MNPPAGCAFHPRCPYAIAACKAQRPKLEQKEPNRFAACIRMGEILGKDYTEERREFEQKVRRSRNHKGRGVGVSAGPQFVPDKVVAFSASLLAKRQKSATHR